jgi:hypothetical protein
MLGFKKSVTPDEFGQAVLSYANDPIIADATRSLGERFDDYDRSKGWKPVFQANDVPIPTVRLYHVFYSHAVLQTHFNSFASGREMTRGAMANFTARPAGYEFGKVFDDLEATFKGQYEFDPGVDSLRNPEAPAPGVLAAKYLMSSFVFPNIRNPQAFVDDFVGFSATVCSTLVTVRRATELILTKFKILG